MQKSKWAGGGLLLVSLTLPSAALAAPLEIESFNYPSSTGQTIDTLNGGTGWGGAWGDGDFDVTLAATNTSLTYPASSPLTSAGGRIELTATDPSAQATRTLGTTMSLATNNQNYYSSALFRRSAVTGETSTVSFFSGGNLRWFYGIDVNGKFSVAVDPGTTTQRATSAFDAAADTTYLVVARFRTNTFQPSGNDEVFLKVFAPGDTVAEPTSDAGWDLSSNGNSGVVLSSIRLDMANAAGQTNALDEFRIGTTFTDVTGVPEPGSIALLGAAAIGLLRRGRRATR